MKDYTISELRKITESYVKKITESFENPSYEEVKSAYDPYPYSDAATVKIVPTVTMMRVAYDIFNKELFNSALPEGISLIVETEADKSHFGFASYRWTNSGGVARIFATGIRLNSKYRMTFHEWLEVILHECVHILEYTIHPEPFIEKWTKNRRYDAHGSWFLSHGSEFDELGFNVRKYCQAASGTYDINVGDSEVSKKYGKSKDNYLIARLIGVDDGNGGADIKISRNFKKKLEFIATDAKRNNEGWWSSITKIEYYTTENPFFINWKKSAPRNSSSGFSYKDHFPAERKYGPFKLDSEFDVSAAAASSASDAVGNANFIESLNTKKLTDKILRTIVGSSFANLYETKYSMKYITPVIKTQNGLMLECPIEKSDGTWKLRLSDDGNKLSIASDWVGEMEIANNGEGIFDDYYMHDAYALVKNEGKPTANAINYAIDDTIDIASGNGYGKIEEYVRNEIAKAIEEMKNRMRSATASNESISMNEDIDEMDVEDRNLISDEYARNVWNINGVVDVVKRDEDTVDVDIF